MVPLSAPFFWQNHTAREVKAGMSNSISSWAASALWLFSKGPVVSVRLDDQCLPLALDVKSHSTIRSWIPRSPLHHIAPPFLMLLLPRSWVHCLKAEIRGLEEDQRRAGALLQLQERCGATWNGLKGWIWPVGLVFDTCVRIRAQVLRERVGTEFLHFFYSRNAVPFAGLEQPSHPSQSFTERRCPAWLTVRGRRTLVIFYVTGCFLYMDSSGSVRVFRHFLDAAMSPGSFCHCSQETLRRSAASYRGI